MIGLIPIAIVGGTLIIEGLVLYKLYNTHKSLTEAIAQLTITKEALDEVEKETETASIEMINLTQKNDLLKEQISTLTEQFQNSKDISKTAFEEYFETLEQNYANADAEYKANYEQIKENAIREYDKLIEDLLNESNKKSSELQKLKRTVDAANEAIRKEQLSDAQKAVYQIRITENDLSDVQKLIALCDNFKNPRALRMIIWSSYFQKEVNELCTRVKVNNVSGIYKLTNLNTNKVYIGQSVKISDRWKQHVKCGLGIDTPQTNSLYKAMLHDGVWNFTFELLEECPQAELNECERKWIAFYESDVYGYNGNKGVGK